jgi:uncharacterized protein
VFDWDDANIDHIAEHGVEPEEAEEALGDPRRVPREAYNVAGERRRAVLGTTLNERVLFVVYTLRGRLTRVVTARDADESERRQYRRRRR